ncbi:GMC oxidoreductase [Multifurca ochricompacta]|uniref:GMC oxidoreductase n=1 Tax=Multifurca ochricompacta TaxID=376703 RepID=A0AAD4QM65_9AGAM|nr:GMC oxidoreductase [Multifurca ochricompacta]
MASLNLPISAESLASLTSLVVDYTGGDSRLGRRVRLGAAFTLVALALRIVASGRPKRSAVQRDLRKVGKVVGEAESEDNFDEYDVVIVGGGTAGCVLASRLSENRDLRVLLLEAGDSAVKDPLVRIPSAFTLMLGTAKVFNLFTTLQQNTGGRRHFWPRAKMLGGCSSINALIFHYGDPADYDEWARLGGEGAETWAYKDFHKYFLKFEKFVPSKAHPQVVANEHGVNGPIEVGFHGNHAANTQRFIDACSRAGIPRLADLNTPRGSLGVAKVLTYIDSRGRRVTTESAYLTPAVLSRPNLKVAVGATATRLIFDTTGPSPRAVGVEFASFKHSARFRVRAKKEVILAYILMLSGVGPEAHLAEHKIPVVAPLSGVGEHLMDHPVVNVAVAETTGTSLNFLKSKTTWHQIQRAYAYLIYYLTGKGPLTTNVAEAAAFFRSTDPVLFPPNAAVPPAPTEDSTSGPHAPDLEFFVSPMAFNGNTSHRPTSLGNILLKSSDPFEHPAINPNYISTEHDLAVLERGMSVLTRVMYTSPLADVIDHTAADVRLGHWLPTAKPTELRTYVRNYLETLYHPTSTARMAPLSDGGVVDAQLKVHGVRGLRVVDASIFPTIVSGHTAGPTIAVAEKASDMILQDLAASGRLA